MIPTAALAGLIAGRWWAIPIIGLAWSLWLMFDGTCTGSCALGSFALGGVNAAVGVGVHMGIRALLRRQRV